jgi:hypothetical protein
VKAIVAQAFAVASAAVADALAEVRALLPMLPPVAQGPVESALTLVTAQLGMVEGLLAEVLDLVGSPSVGGQPTGGLVGGILEGVGSLLDSLLGQAPLGTRR